MCPGLAELSNLLARISADQCMKFCDDTSSVATPTLNNPQNLDLDYLITSFAVETRTADEREFIYQVR